MRVPYIDLPAQYRDLKPQIDAAMQRVMESGGFILRDEVKWFEERMASYLGVNHVIGVGNGYDALFLALQALNIYTGDRVLTQSYTHVSTHAAIRNCGAELLLDEAKGPLSAVLPVHMNGRTQRCDWYESVPVVEDACQALGASYKGKKAGTFGIMGCFSLHPMKVLGCAGDGGFISTNDDGLNKRLRELRNHGMGNGYGYNSRLDTLQAAILNVKFDRLDWYIERRRYIAQRYEDGLKWDGKPPGPSTGDHFDVYSSYVLKAGPELLNHLKSKDIEVFSHIREDCVSLPIFPEMTEDQIDYVIDGVNSYHRR